MSMLPRLECTSDFVKLVCITLERKDCWWGEKLKCFCWHWYQEVETHELMNRARMSYQHNMAENFKGHRFFLFYF